MPILEICTGISAPRTVDDPFFYWITQSENSTRPLKKDRSGYEKTLSLSVCTRVRQCVPIILKFISP